MTGFVTSGKEPPGDQLPDTLLPPRCGVASQVSMIAFLATLICVIQSSPWGLSCPAHCRAADVATPFPRAAHGAPCHSHNSHKIEVRGVGAEWVRGDSCEDPRWVKWHQGQFDIALVWGIQSDIGNQPLLYQHCAQQGEQNFVFHEGLPVNDPLSHRAGQGPVRGWAGSKLRFQKTFFDVVGGWQGGP